LTGTIAESDERTSSCFSVGSVAGTYDEIYVPRIFIPWAQLLLARAALRPGEAVLDIATGPGTVARLAAEQVGRKGRVVGADFSEAMIAIARAKPPSAGAAPIEYLVSPAAPLAITEGGFDVVTCQQGLQFFDDPVRALERVRKSLRNDGRLHIALWTALEDHPLTASIQRALLDSALDELTGFLSKAHSLHDPGMVRTLLEKAGFRVEREASADIVPDGSWYASDGPRLLAASPMCTRLNGVSEDQRNALSRALAAQFQRYEHDGKLDLHFAANFYTAVPA